MSKWAETALPCPCGKSSDAYAVDKDGDGYCFSCAKPFKNEGDELTEELETEHVTTPAGMVEYQYRSHRGISAKTMEFYNAYTKLVNGTPFSIQYVYPNESSKVRVLPKKFFAQGPIGEAHLFGEQLFPAGSREFILITEGEDDAMSAYEMLDGRVACVSVKNAQTAFGDVKARREYLNSFKRIILCLDNDRPGQEATRMITSSGIFDYNKLYRVRLVRKDAHEYLENSEKFVFQDLVRDARRFTPDSLINSFEDIKRALDADAAEVICNYPFSGLQNALLGLHKSEFILLKGLEGRGKTEVCRAILYEAVKNTTQNVGVIFMEEPKDRTIKGVATYELEVPCSLESAGVSKDDILNAYKKAVGEDEGRIYIHDHFATEDESELIDNVRFLVTIAGCNIILLDNLTMLTTGRESEDERLRIDRTIRRLRDLVTELHFCLILVAHVNDEGQTRGSRLPDKLCDTVFSVTRDITAASVSVKNTNHFMVEKKRTEGADTGPAGSAFFDPITFKLRDVREADGIVMPY